MFGFSAKEQIIDKQNEYIKKLETENAEYETLIENLNDVSRAAFLVDFTKINAFSIERIVYKDGHAKTVIGHILNGEIREWNLGCTLEQHNQIAQEFLTHSSKGKRK